ncbi:unnamed protein product [Gadus morhua 'NCC']
MRRHARLANGIIYSSTDLPGGRTCEEFTGGVTEQGTFVSSQRERSSSEARTHNTVYGVCGSVDNILWLALATLTLAPVESEW